MFELPGSAISFPDNTVGPASLTSGGHRKDDQYGRDGHGKLVHGVNLRRGARTMYRCHVEAIAPSLCPLRLRPLRLRPDTQRP